MIKDARHYDTIVSPVITEKATIASESNQFVFKVRREATKPQIKAAIEKLFDVKVTAVNTLLRKGKNKVFRGVRGKQQDVKKAVVTLADGHRIDVTSGLKGSGQWLSRHTIRRPRAYANWPWSIAASSTRASRSRL